MYGFGDHRHPEEASVEVLESYVEEFILNLVTRALKRSQRNNSNVVTVADTLRVLKQDEKKYLRMPYVLTMNKILKGAKQELDPGKKGAEAVLKNSLL